MSGSNPKVKAFLICDQVIRSTDGKYSIIGIFRRVHAPNFPVFHARFGVYLMLGDMNGEYDFTIEFVDPTEGNTLAKAELRGVKHQKPLEDFETGINLPGLQFPKDGTFEIHLVCNGDLLHVDTLHAIKVDSPPPPPSTGGMPPPPGQ
ncbi:MAG: hypothetical protein KDB68_08795 [Planctomycetes bacterium]|nr:hypothetical protein [Planctomycetota bacterium]